MKRRPLLIGFVLAGGLAFGFFGGEYGTWDWLTLERAVEAEAQAIERLEVEIDSLAEEAQALESDSATQERVAREAFGMVRPGEILYRVEKSKP